MSQVSGLLDRRTVLEGKIRDTEGMIGHGLDWKDAQTFLEKYREELRVLDNQIAKTRLGESAVSELSAKKQQLETTLTQLNNLRNTGDISDKVYKEKKRDIQRDIETIEKDIVRSM